MLVYGYVSNIYSSWKQLVKRASISSRAARRFLSSMSYPDHNTINRFRA
ncbi:transposase [Dyadobacter soli]